MKKVLIITYYWPPAGGPGVQRWLNFVKYLPQHQIKPIVYIPSNPNYPIVDNDIINEVPKGVQLISQPIFEPYNIANMFGKNNSKTISKGIISDEKQQTWKQKTLLWIRGNVFIPDARKFWISPSVKFLSKYITEHHIDTIITTGPPHSIHLIGLKLKNKLSLKWIADFRDPWTTIGYHQKLKLSNKAKRKHLLLEKQVLNSSDQLITTSWGTQKEFSNKTATPIAVITNGFDEIKPIAIELDKKFTLSHIGSLLSERNPINLWLALAELTNENNDFATYFQLNLAGVVSESIIKSIKQHGLSNYLNTLGYISHAEAIQLQHKTQLLLLIEINSEITKAIIPGKLFEYLQAKRPILGVGPKNADLAKIIKETQSGTFFHYNEKEKIKAQILTYFEDFKQHKLNITPNNINQYTRQSLTQKLANLIRQ